jgi:CHAT domain-containing protein
MFALPNVSEGADKIAGDFHSPRVLIGADATLTAVTKALPSAAVFHFAGHAITSANHSGLILNGKPSSSGTSVLLDANVVRQLHLPETQLALLAACGTDSGDAGSRGVDSVAEAFQTAGVPHVVASRWEVDSVFANTFAETFYGFLLHGQPVSSAVRMTAQKMLLRPGTPHPYYWAAFAAYGHESSTQKE